MSSNDKRSNFKSFVSIATYTAIGTFCVGLYQFWLNSNDNISSIKWPANLDEFIGIIKGKKTKKYVKYTCIGVGVYVAFKILFRERTIKSDLKYSKPNPNELSYYDEKEQYWCTDPSEQKPIIKAKSGPASIEPVQSGIIHFFKESVKFDPNKYAFGKEYKNNSGEYEWKFTTRVEYYNLVYSSARSFVKLGLQPFQAVCIIGFNSPEWCISAVGCIFAGGITCGLYTTNNSGQIIYITNHCKCHTIVCENKKQLNKILPILNELKTVQSIVVYDDNIDGIDMSNSQVKLMDWNQFLSVGDTDKSTLDIEIEKRINNVKPGQCAALVYTSGTTGNPKGTMISHDSIMFDTYSLMASIPTVDWKNIRLISYLPLSHIAGSLCDIYGPIVINGAYSDSNFVVYFARKDALKGSLPKTLKYVKPTLFLGVPRVWEKIEAKLKEIGQKGGFITKTLGTIAKSIGAEYFKNKMINGNKHIPLGFKLCDKIIFSKIKKQLGLDCCQVAATAAAPIKASTLKYFGSLNIHITQIYGLSETSGASTAGIQYHDDVGSVGVPLKGCEVLIDHVDGRDKINEGEILLRGRNIMSGYLYNKDKSQEAIDSKGFFHTGDVGKIDDNGLVYITGRIKELIITAGGENVAPVPIEQYLKTELPALSNIVLIGDKKKYLTILVTLQCKQNSDGVTFSNTLIGPALKINPNVTTVDGARNDDVWKTYIDSAIKKYNNDENACVSRAQRVQYFCILNGDFSVGIELTDSLKLKRRVINEKYKQQIQSMYK